MCSYEGRRVSWSEPDPYIPVPYPVYGTGIVVKFLRGGFFASHKFLIEDNLGYFRQIPVDICRVHPEVDIAAAGGDDG